MKYLKKTIYLSFLWILFLISAYFFTQYCQSLNREWSRKNPYTYDDYLASKAEPVAPAHISICVKTAQLTMLQFRHLNPWPYFLFVIGLLLDLKWKRLKKWRGNTAKADLIAVISSGAILLLARVISILIMLD